VRRPRSFKDCRATGRRRRSFAFIVQFLLPDTSVANPDYYKVLNIKMYKSIMLLPFTLRGNRFGGSFGLVLLRILVSPRGEITFK
jgi:hypothetical protein